MTPLPPVPPRPGASAPLTGLPAPRPLPHEDTVLIPPGEIIADSKRAILRRMLRISWAPGLMLLGLWYVLLVLYVLGASPTFWFFSLLAAIGDATYLRAALLGLGFSTSGLATAFLLLPAAATLLSLALTPLVPQLLAGLQPRRFLTEQAFQRTVATRATAVLMLPPAAAVLLWPLTVLMGVPQPWSGLGAGPLSSWCLSILALEVTWVLVRRQVTAPKLLGITDAAALQVTARIGADAEERAAAAQQVRAQDRRHLPPNLGTPALSRAATPRGALVALAGIARASLVWVVPAAAGLGWLVFAITDLVTVIVRLSAADLSGITSPLRWQQMLIAAPVAALVLLGLALAPALAVMLAAGEREQVRDQRTYEDWAHRARVNPWEARVVALTGWLSAAIVVTGTAAAVVLLQLLQIATALSWVWAVTITLVLAPLLGLAAASAMRSGLRDVLYGPAGGFMRRRSPYALVAPDIGTRADRAKDPAVRAALRKRLKAAGGDHALEIFDLDAAGERLWVADGAPGAQDAAVRDADLVSGVLPDFGGEGSAFTGGGRPGGTGTVGGGAAGARHDVPDSVPGLREL